MVKIHFLQKCSKNGLVSEKNSLFFSIIGVGEGGSEPYMEFSIFLIFFLTLPLYQNQISAKSINKDYWAVRNAGLVRSINTRKLTQYHTLLFQLALEESSNTTTILKISTKNFLKIPIITGGYQRLIL